MSANSLAWRAGAFIRSVLPAEPAHWLILVGSTLLFISPSIQWWVGPHPHAAETFGWGTAAAVVGLPLRIAGIIGYYLCFVPRKKRRYFPFHIAFVLAGTALAVMIVLGASWESEGGGGPSVIERAAGSVATYSGPVFKNLIGDFNIGFWLPLLGLVFLAVFFAMLRVGRSSVPIHLSGHETRSEADRGFATEQRRTMFVAWAMISLTPLAGFGVIPFVVIFETVGKKFANAHLNYLGQAQHAWTQICFFVFLVLVLGNDAKKTLRASFRIPPLLYLGISMLLPAALAAIWPLLTFVYDRIHWAAFAFGMYDAPRLETYLVFPIWWHIWSLAGALFEEIAWRGFLQPRFVRRYGIARGIFLLGLVWGAFHFYGDYRSSTDAASVAVTLVWRLYMTVALSYALAWLTIRSGSVLPAALAHGFYNIFLNFPARTSPWLLPALWAVCAWLLFRYFPVEAASREAAREPGPTLEPAV